MGDEDNLELTEFQGAEGQPPDAGQDTSRPGNAKDLDAVYDIPVQVSAVGGRAWVQVSQRGRLGRGAVGLLPVPLIPLRHDPAGIVRIREPVHPLIGPRELQHAL